jgi:hypothetical protein
VSLHQEQGHFLAAQNFVIHPNPKRVCQILQEKGSRGNQKTFHLPYKALRSYVKFQ